MKEIFDFLQIAEKLKCEKRDNKLSNGDFETVAGHTWMMGLFALLFYDKMENPVDIGRALKIILVHDLAEAGCGDIGLAAQQNLKTADKFALESDAINAIAGRLPAPKAAEILELWNEYESQSTPEARFAKACDKLEANAQSLMFGKVKYWSDYDPDFYYDDMINNRREKYWGYEPAFREFHETYREIGMQYMKAEGIGAEKYLKKS